MLGPHYLVFMNTDYKDIIKTKFSERCERNNHYSLRAFARDLGISPQRLSHILNGRHGISETAAEAMALKLGMNQEETQIFCMLVQEKHARSKVAKNQAIQKLQEIKSSYKTLDVDHFKIISDWYHFAIMELTQIEGFSSSPKWIAKALGITELQVKAAIERLLRLEMLNKDKKGKLSLTGQFFADPKGVPSEALRKFHRQLMSKASEALDFQGLDERDVTSLILAFNGQDIPEAKKDIKKFRDGFDKKFSKNKIKDQVYCLGIQLFNLKQRTER